MTKPLLVNDNDKEPVRAVGEDSQKISSLLEVDQIMGTTSRQQEEESVDQVEVEPHQQQEVRAEDHDQHHNDSPNHASDGDHKEPQQHPPNAYTTASFISKLLFMWPYPLLRLGMTKTLTDHDLPQNTIPDTSQYSLQYFLHNIWYKEQQRVTLINQKNHEQQQQQEQRNGNNKSRKHAPKRIVKPNLRRAVAIDYFTSMWYAQILMAIGATAKVMQAYMLGKLINYFTTTNSDTNSKSRDGYIYALRIVICGCIILFEHHHLFFYTWRKGMQLRISCIAAIYNKCTYLSSISASHVSHRSTTTGSSSNETTTTTTTSNPSATATSTSSSSLSNVNGQVMNLVSNDVERFLMAALFVNYIIWGPVQSIAILIVGFTLMSYAFLIGFIVLIVLFIPLQIYFSTRFAYYRNLIAQYTDARVTTVSQAIRGVRIMKMYGYENHYAQQIMNHRTNEVQQIKKANNLKAYNEAFVFITNIIISLIIFIIHVTVFNKPLDQGTVFTVYALINILQMELTKHVSLAVMGASELYVSLGRIQKFLELPELVRPNTTNIQQSSSTSSNAKQYEDDSVAIALDKVNCYWNGDVHSGGYEHGGNVASVIVGHNSSVVESDANSAASSSSYATPSIVPPAIRDVTIQFRSGALTAIIGTVGCGKSALIQAIVQELPISSGTLYYRPNKSTISYAAQDPWIMDGTIRENILLGQSYDKAWYDEVVAACALVQDIQQFQYGDLTIVGDRGVQCSGGQRARIGLARAIYRKADILIIDDPLSAVDTKVGRQLYDNAIVKLNVNKGKCVVLATHQHQYVQDWTCVFMDHGTVKCIGSYDECVQASNGKLKTSISNTNLQQHEHEENQSEPLTLSSINGNNAAQEGEVSTGRETPTATTTKTKGTAITSRNKDDDVSNAKAGLQKETSSSAFKEMNHVGRLDVGTYYNYVCAMGGLWVGVALLVLFTITQGSVLLTIITVGRWSQRPTYNDQMDWKMISRIVGLGVLVIVLAVFRAMVTFRYTIKASQNLHNQMTRAVLRAKIQFFDTNPMGRILNRFSADIGIMDDQLPPTLYDFTTLSFVVLGAVATTITTLPFVLLVIPFIVWYFISVRRVFVTSTRELKRLEGLARSPIFAMMSESLNGIATIRSNNALEYFRSKFESVHDTHTRCFFAFIAASRWVGFRMDSLVFFLLTMSSFLSVLFHEQGWFNVDATVLGLSLSLLLQLAGLFQWCVRQSAEVVNQFVSVERVLGFGAVESEAPLYVDGDDELLASGWPQKGSIQFKDVSVRYRTTLPLALRNVQINIEPGSRVGVVGRSGSGKSTFMQTLFRLLEVEEGQILIDNVDISKIGLHTLRRKLSVIPQVPTLFSNCTLRDNLDLLHQYSDREIEKVLTSCHLSDLVDELPNGYNTLVVDGSFSTGQRQLFCLARALLSRNAILILDEATANVDQYTDHLIQQTLMLQHKNIRYNEENLVETVNDFNGATTSTMIAIAHRLDTVIDYDRIYVFGNGEVLESGSPFDLLSSTADIQERNEQNNEKSAQKYTTGRGNGVFQSMVDDTGRIMAQELYRRSCVAAQSAGQQRRGDHSFSIVDSDDDAPTLDDKDT